jgi:hypothetical protein
MKLFLQENGNDPECYEGIFITECIIKVLECLEEDTEYLLSDTLELMAKLAENYNDRKDEGFGGTASSGHMSVMMDQMIACYGYDTFESYERDRR